LSQSSDERLGHEWATKCHDLLPSTGSVHKCVWLIAAMNLWPPVVAERLHTPYRPCAPCGLSLLCRLGRSHLRPVAPVATTGLHTAPSLLTTSAEAAQ
jgi:hypothetical protein